MSDRRTKRQNTRRAAEIPQNYPNSIPKYQIQQPEFLRSIRASSVLGRRGPIHPPAGHDHPGARSPASSFRGVTNTTRHIQLHKFHTDKRIFKISLYRITAAWLRPFQRWLPTSPPFWESGWPAKPTRGLRVSEPQVFRVSLPSYASEHLWLSFRFLRPTVRKSA